MSAAADLPEGFFYTGSGEMAMMLVKTMHCPRAIRARILEEFDRAPGVVSIERMMRDVRVTKQDDPQPLLFSPHYEPKPTRDFADKDVNAEYVRRIEVEREASHALRSTYLTRPQDVNKAWERLCNG